ncbi:hypothetical protein CA13_43130 [Planctomycetes bacterium CA13]|uniref:Uncharacterized protein n=1 Tax=Novipirellula herctigrandis TaxID=2527986 RepID=A0A5C5Z6P4_9BACT|nr:hypothetical protein CA13_43130 [Planctomycetes bacterium CA13]
MESLFSLPFMSACNCLVACFAKIAYLSSMLHDAYVDILGSLKRFHACASATFLATVADSTIHALNQS